MRTLLARVRARLGRQSTAVLQIVAATAVGQLVALAATPILSRLFPPAEYGFFSVVNSIALTAAVVAAMRFDQALSLPKSETEAHALARLALWMVLALTSTGLLVILLAGGWFVSLMGYDPRIRSLLIWAPLIAGLMGAYLVLSQLAVRKRLYASIARRNFYLATATVVTQILAGLLGLGAAGLAAGLAVGQMVALLALAKDIGIGWREDLHQGSRRSMFVRYRKFPLLLAPSGALNALGVNAPVLVAAALMGARTAGLLGMTQRVLLIPLALIGVAASQVFLGEFATAVRSEAADLENRFLAATRRLAVLAVIVAVVVIVASPWAFTTVLGQEWSEAATFAQVLAISAAAQLVSSPLSQSLIVLEKVAWQVAWDAGRLAVTVSAMVAAWEITKSAEWSVAALAAASACAYLTHWLLSWRAVRGRSVLNAG